MTNNPLLRTICPKCGTAGQVYLTFESISKAWECTCYACGKDFEIPNSEIPPELQNQRYRFSEHVLKSNGIPQSNFPHYTNKGIKE